MRIIHTESFRTAPSHRLGKIEHLTLTGLMFFLPLLEAPKNLLWLAFVSTWIGSAFFARAGWGGSWHRERDMAFALLLLAAFLSCLFAAPFPQHWQEFGDVLRYVLLGWLLARSSLTERQLLATLAALLAGAIIAAAQGWWRWQISETRPLFELHSVGHVNHSLLYLSIVTLGTIGALIVLWSRLPAYGRAVLLLLVGMQAWLLVTGESRGALIGFLIGAAIILWAVASRRYRFALLGGAVMAVGIMLAANPYLIDKSLGQLQGISTPGTVSSYRVELAATALEATRAKPMTGIGPGNFHLATAEQIATWLEARNMSYDPTRYFHSSHAHGLYFNTLAERGLLGGVALLFLAWAWLRQLISRPGQAARCTQRATLAWVVGMSGFIGVFVTGLFNTSLHHEHGMLAMFALGVLMTEARIPLPRILATP